MLPWQQWGGYKRRQEEEVDVALTDLTLRVFSLREGNIGHVKQEENEILGV